MEGRGGRKKKNRRTEVKERKRRRNQRKRRNQEDGSKMEAEETRRPPQREPVEPGPPRDKEEGDKEEGDKVEGDKEEGDKEEGDKVEGDKEEGDKEEGDKEEGDKVEGDKEEGDKEEGDKEEGDKEEGDRRDRDAMMAAAQTQSAHGEKREEQEEAEQEAPPAGGAGGVGPKSSSKALRRDGSPGRRPPAAAMFRLRLHAVMDRRFNFHQQNHSLLLIGGEQEFPLHVSHCVRVPGGGCLLDAVLLLEEQNLHRGTWMSYSFRVKQKHKVIHGDVIRHALIPSDRSVTELHLYEGFISRREEQSVLQTGLQLIGLRRPRGEELAEFWQNSARFLLDRIFHTWNPSDKRSTENLTSSLLSFKESLGSAHMRMRFQDGSAPPAITVSELISDLLVQVLKGGPTVPDGCRSTGPVVLGLVVFMVSSRCDVDLGGTGWTRLCLLVSSDASEDELLRCVQHPQHVLLALMNRCVQLGVSELVLLLPLLFRLRHPGADALKVDPDVEEQNWAGLEGVQFCRFREMIQSHPERRRRMLALIRDQVRDQDQGKDQDRVRDQDRGKDQGKDQDRGEVQDQVRDQDQGKDQDRVRDQGKDQDQDQVKDQDRGKDQGKDQDQVRDQDRVRDQGEDQDQGKDQGKDQDRGEDQDQDLPEFSDLTGIPAEQLVQSLLYRLRGCGQKGGGAQDDMKHAEATLSRLLLKVDEEKDRMACCGATRPTFLSSVAMVRSSCAAVRRVAEAPAVVLSCRLMLKLAQSLAAELKSESGDLELKMLQDVGEVLQRIREWREELLQRPVMAPPKTLSYPQEIQMWDSLMRLECSVGDVSSGWRRSLKKDLMKRVSQASEEDQVLVCCLEAASIRKSHDDVQACFQELSQAAIRAVCQRRQEGDLLRSLGSRLKHLPVAVTSALVVESAAGFGGDGVSRLLHPQSALNHLLSHGDWKQIQVDDAAGQVVRACQSELRALVASLLLGGVALGHLQTCLKHRPQFERLYLQHEKNSRSEALPVGADVLLAQREKDLNAFLLRKQQVDVLIKMIAKVTESISVPEVRSLEVQHAADLKAVSLNQLLLVPSFEAGGSGTRTPPQVIWYKTSLNVLKMCSQMHKLHHSSLVLGSWVKRAAPQAGAPVSVSLTHIWNNIWTPLLDEFFQLAVSIDRGDITFQQLDQVLVESGDQGDGALMRQELSLMWETFSESGGGARLDLRLRQIQDYRRLQESAAAAGAILRIAETMKLSGNFTEILALSQLEDHSFKQRTLGSLTEDLLRASQQLSTVTRQHTACLQEFLASQSLVVWVRENLRTTSDVKVYVELASISAGENDREVDQVVCFHDAVMGYAPLLYATPRHAGFKEFMRCAQQVWDALSRDEKLPDKLRESTRLLSWLKALKETHGSVEQSSLSLASSINADGVYHIGWSSEKTGRRCLGNMVHVSVRTGSQEKSYKLEDLLELQNKLMLMSSKGEHSREQVNRFTEVFEGVQRLGSILLQMQTSGNMLFRDWHAEVWCWTQQEPCIKATFLSLMGTELTYHGEVTQQLQKLAQSMESCQNEWRSFVVEMRCDFGLLNLYTSEQMVFLCHWIHKVCEQWASAPPQLWHLLFPIKPQCTLTDIRAAYAYAADMTSVYEENDDDDDDDDDDDEHQHYESSMDVTPAHTEEELEEVQDLMQFSSEDEDDGAMKCDPGGSRKHEDESLEKLWGKFKGDMHQYLHEYLDISTLAHFLLCLSERNQEHVNRNLPPILQEGKPNLLLCPSAEVLTTVLSFYMESPEQPLPSADEVLVCREETTEEEVEIFLRRALGQPSEPKWKKIYCLVDPGLLGYDVSVAFGELFESLKSSANPRYRLVLVSPVELQHRYVPSFFSSDKVQAGVTLTAETARRYLHVHFTQNMLPQCPAALVSPDHLSVWMVSSARPAVGKSLYVDRLFEKLLKKCPTAENIKIRLIEPHVDVDALIKSLSEKQASGRERDPVLLHVDTAGVRSGLEEFLFHLLILGCVSDSHGMLWRRNAAHLITVEVLRTHTSPGTHSKQVRLGLLDVLPSIHCRPPKEVKQLLASRGAVGNQTFDPLMDQQEFCSEGIQRPYQYLQRYRNNMDLDHFNYETGSRMGEPTDCISHFLLYCGMEDPSWAELKNFSWFLNVQLKDCENSVFCDPDFLADQLPGFKGFIVKFMILMSRDFASPSLNTSDESPTLHIDNSQEDDLLTRLTIRKRWENEPHPYIFFNADQNSMSFLGFNVQKCPRRKTLNAVDPHSLKVLIGDVMSEKLSQGLERQRISLTEDFDELHRREKIKRISCVVGAKKVTMDPNFDPDPTYELTADNVMKMLAIHMRFRCGIPVVIMGETGCGKTRLVRFLCALQREDRPVENMVLVKVHGGTTAETLYRKVREAEKLAENNRRMHKLDTILFFDEANTTEAIFAIKEILCDQSMKGKRLKTRSGLKIIAACNPYRKHSPEMVERLERAGLGYRVKADQTKERLGKVPLRQLVYRVHPLPPSMASLVWDFGQLSDSTELAYIKQIVKKNVKDHLLPVVCTDIISDVLGASQKYMRSHKNECSFVSLRDVERSMKVLVWFYQHSEVLLSNISDKVHKTLKCLILSVGVCYYPSLVVKEPYLSIICRYFPTPLCSSTALQAEISSCQDFFLQNIKTRETIAKNIALKENVFLMVVCIELRIPLFLVGKPGSSKSLAKTVVADAMQGQNSHCGLFKELKQAHMVSFQCSPHSSPEGIIGTFRNCARFQKDKNMDDYVSVVVLDEIGLAEDSPQMPLKTLHPLLEDGCIDSEKPDAHMKVGFVGISNWALDPAKMNRGIFVSRWDPSQDELVETAKGICSSSQQIHLKIKHLFPSLAKAFLNICEETSKNQFFGLRDYYSLVKMLFATVKSTQQEPNGGQLVEAILRNFSGQPEGFDPVRFFQEVLQNEMDIPRPSTLQMVKKNLDLDTNNESRYLLLLTTNNAALHILQQQVFAKADCPPPEIVFGSGFPKDQEYAQICRNVNRVKTCMETGRTVILLNMQNLYESLYDALNQYYVYLSQQQYVDLGLGSHRVKCRVNKRFRLVVVEDQKKVYELFPVPLINRLEKHRVDRSTDLEPWQHRVLHRLQEWVKEFSGEAAEEFQLSDIFVGYHSDACACALLQALEGKNTEDRTGRRHQQSERDEAMEDVGTNEEKRASNEEEGDGMDVEAAGIVLEKKDNESAEMFGRSEGGETMETENNLQPTWENQEEELFSLAKCLLLNCATPDAVVRLKYSDLANQETEKLQRMYFQQQRHHSLRDLLEGCLSKHQRCSRFLEITTFSSLLTRADVRVVANAVGLPTDKILLLSLHQFDTQVSFCNKIRGFLQDAGSTLHLLLIQMDLEESHCSDELIASAKYCTMNYLMSLEDQPCWVIFIAKVSRVATRSQYIGFQGGVWHSVHIDDLRDSEDMSLNLLDFCGTLISNLLSPEPAEHHEKMARTTFQLQTEGALHSPSLVRSCIQKAVGLLRDTGGAAPRSMQRMHILLTLLGTDQGHVGGRFQEALLSRLAKALAQREENSHSPKEWVSREARRREALQEGGTLRHTLWRRLQATVTPILANMVEVMDRYANLELLCAGRLPPGLVTLWLDILADPQLSELAPLPTHSESDQEVLVEHYFMLDGEERPCDAAFSWLISRQLQILWEESEFMPGTKRDGAERILQFVSSFTSSRLGRLLHKLSAEDRREHGRRFLEDFLLLSLKTKSTEELRVLVRAVLGCVAELQSSTGAAAHLSPAWITAAAKHFALRLDALHHILLLQPQLASHASQQGSQGEMVEDILALGVCVEKTKQLTVTSLQECESFVRRVELLQPCLDRALAQKYRLLCSPGLLQRLDAIRSLWDGMLVVASFIQNVVSGVELKDSRLKHAVLKHCNLLLNLMQESADVSRLDTLNQLIRILNSLHGECISGDLRFGVSCPVCLEAFSQPSVLPCGHVFCLPCLQTCFQTNRRCPACRAEPPPDFRPAVSHSIEAQIQQQAAVRGCCNSFFLDLVSRFCLSAGRRPAQEVVELLFSLLVSANGDVYRTRALTPFLQCVDNSPVVRSVLPKLLLQHSFQEVKAHIQSYLRSLEQNLLSGDDLTELYLLFVRCFQDALLCSGGRAEPAESSFLSRVARKQTPKRQEDPADFLLTAARLRLCLGAAARLLAAAGPGGRGAESGYLRQVRAVCEYSGNDWYRVYLLRALHRVSGMDRLLALMKDPAWRWVFPPEVLRLQRMIPSNVDRFLCCGPVYRALRDAVGQVLLENRCDAFRAETQKLRGPQTGLLVLALFRQVTCRYRSPEASDHPTPQDAMRVEELLKSSRAELRAFCAALLANEVGGAGSRLHAGPGAAPHRQTLLELLVHLDSLLLCGDALLLPLQQIAFQPQSMTNYFLPTMPDDQTTEATRWMSGERVQLYYCTKGHPCFVGECGKPVVVSRCADCGSPVGGSSHQPVRGFTKHTGTSVTDQTRRGHVLGEAPQRSEAPERQMSSAESCLLRLLTHLSMLQGAVTRPTDVADMIHPRPSDVFDFLWSHLEKDLRVLGHTLGQNTDNTAVTVHLVLYSCSNAPTGSLRPDLSSTRGRQQWEERVCGSAVRPVLQHLQRNLTEAQERIAADGGLAGSPLMKLLQGDPAAMLSVPSRCPTQGDPAAMLSVPSRCPTQGDPAAMLSVPSRCPTLCSSFWTPVETVTLESFSQLLEQHQERSSVPLLVMFLRKIHCVKLLHHLPELVELQTLLLKAFPLTSHQAEQSVQQMLQQISAGHQKKVLKESVQRFMEVWNSLRAEVANYAADLGVDVDLCEEELTAQSSGMFLTPARHGPGSCLRTLVQLLLETHNSLVREARRDQQGDREHSVPLERVSETQLVRCHPDQLLPLVVTHRHYTLKTGGETHSSYDLPGLQTQLRRRFLSGKPIIQGDTSRLLNRRLQDFSVVLAEVRAKIHQVPLKGSACSSMRAVLRSYTHVCDAVFVLEIGLRFLGKTGGDPRARLLSFLSDSLQMEPQISSSVAKSLAESRLEHSSFTWQLLTCWKSELMLNTNQDPFQRLPSEFQLKLSEEEKKALKLFLAVTDVETFSLELHEILLLKTGGAAPDQAYQPHWDIRYTLEFHLEQKELPPLLGLQALAEDITLGRGADVWREAMQFKKR